MIAIIIPLYNRETLIGETLDSIMTQTYADWECIVVDDHSTDDSAAVVQKYAEKDPRIKLLSRPDDRLKGACACRNFGFKNSKGELVYFFDSDDLLSPQFFETVEQKMSEHPQAEYGIVSRNYFLSSPEHKKLSEYKFFRTKNINLHKDVFEQFVSMDIIPSTPDIIWRRPLLERQEMLWREGLSRCQDVDMGYRVLAHADVGKRLDMPTMVHIRKHGDQLRLTRIYPEIAKVQMETFIRSYKYLEKKNKMTPATKQGFLKGLCKTSHKSAIVTGDREAVKMLYDFIREHCVDVPGRCFFLWDAKFTYYLTPILFFLGNPLYRNINNPVIRWCRETIFR